MHCKINFKVRINTRLASPNDQRKIDQINELNIDVFNVYTDAVDKDIIVLTGRHSFEADSFLNSLSLLRFFDLESDCIAYMCVLQLKNEKESEKMTHIRTSLKVQNVYG